MLSRNRLPRGRAAVGVGPDDEVRADRSKNAVLMEYVLQFSPLLSHRDINKTKTAGDQWNASEHATLVNDCSPRASSVG